MDIFVKVSRRSHTKPACLGSQHRLRIGPLYADSKLVAAKLLHSLLSAHEDIATRRVQILSLSRQPATRELIEAISSGLIELSVNVPMCTDSLPNVDYDRIFAQADQNLNFV
jgi:hypothetical protein